jgi:molecular chaperone HtpG
MGLRLLETLTSALYDDPIILFREYVQNSVDAYNKAIDEDPSYAFNDFCVDIKIDKENRVISVIDNGYGIPVDAFKDKMTSIGASDKSNSPNQIGFRGIGRLSAMPFCEKLIFTNKPTGSDKPHQFIWAGSTFHDLLNKESETELGDAIDQISSEAEIDYQGDANAHFFRVEIQYYNAEIAELVAQTDFIGRLKMMLPLKYDPSFKYKQEIDDRYSRFMGEHIDKFAFDVKLDGDYLYKPYKNSNILESGIYYWELTYRSKEKGIPGEKIGLLWYTFNRKVTANPLNGPYGILVRSKNMLMGDHNALADAMFRSKSDDYVATFRELTQTLQGVYGEMLLHSTRLKDNARRDWFRPDAASIELRDIIFDFMKRLHVYRNVASKAFNAIENDKNKQKLTEAFVELTSNYEPKEFLASFYDSKKKNDESKAEGKDESKGESRPETAYEFADEDIPHSTITIKKFYDKLMSSVKEYFVNKDELQNFLRMRAHIKKQLNGENKK